MPLTTSASARLPIKPSASAARPSTIGSGSSSAFVSAARADWCPINPSANAAICRTSTSSSATSGSNGSTPSTRPTRPTASAARRLMRAWGSLRSATRSDGAGRAKTAAVFGRGLQERRRWRRGILQNPLVLEPEHPRELLFRRDIRRGRWSWSWSGSRDDGNRNGSARRGRKRKAE